MAEETPSLPSKYRRLSRRWRPVTLVFPAVAVLLGLLFLFHWYPFGWAFSVWTYRFYLVAIFIPLCFIWIRASKKAPVDRVPWYDILLGLLTIAIALYFAAQEQRAEYLEIRTPPLGTALGLTLWLLVLEAGRRAAGPVFAGVIAFFSFYPLFGSYLPGLFWAPPVPLDRTVAYHIISDESLMGIPMTIFANIFFGFMLFAVVVQRLGAGKFFTDVAMGLLGTTRAGGAKVATVSSGFFGSISGAAVANVLVTGAFTIPAMKKEGLSGEFAGAVEAVASTGGQLMPPVMGISAFVMAEFIGISYAQVCIAAIIPSLLYYITIFAHVDAQAGRQGIKAPPQTVKVPPLWLTLVNNLHIIIGMVALIFVLFYLRRVTQAAWLAAAVVIILSMLRKETRPTLRWIPEFLSDLGRVLGELIAMMAPIGLIIGAFFVTGIAYSIPSLLLKIAGGNMFILLLLGAGASYILGMGANVVACYIFLAILLAPALVNMGFDIMAAHLFVMYWAMMANITPPVAPAAIAAASISGAGPMKTGLVAMRLAGAKYILPFIFVLSPALILRGPITETLMLVPLTLIGFIIISSALEGYTWRIGNITMLSRAVLLVTGTLIAWPTSSTTIYGAGTLVMFAGLYLLLRLTKNPAMKILLQATPGA
ncbi:TRAP transporter permease [Chloroflexota bacterium]